VTAQDAAGNRVSASLTVTYDPTPPETTITDGPPAGSAPPSLSFRWSGLDNLTPVGSLVYAFRLDPLEPSFSAFVPATTKTYAGLATGAYTFYVKARDLAGNEDPTPASRTVSVGTPAGTATLSVQALADTRIFLGGSYGYLGTLKGPVPASGTLPIPGLPAGRYVVQARRAGFLDAYRVVDLAPGQTTLLTIDLIPFNPQDTLGATLSELQTGASPILGGGGGSTPAVTDWDSDGKKDLLVGGKDGRVLWYRNEGTDIAPGLAAGVRLQADGADLVVPGPAALFVVDWDGDGAKDLLVGDGAGFLHWYRNVGTDAAPGLTLWATLAAGGSTLQVAGPAAPVVVDWNGDGAKDLLVGDGDGQVVFFRNTGTDAAPELAAGVAVLPPDVGSARANARVVPWSSIRVSPRW